MTKKEIAHLLGYSFKYINYQFVENESKYKELMDAKMLNIADGDLENARKRVNDLIRTVNQCITLLNER